MAFVQVFCFWFSVRLGSIIIGITTLIQACTWLTFCVLWMEDPDENAKEFNDFLNELSVTDGFLRNIAGDSKTYLTALAGFFTALTFASALLVLGSFQCKPILLYPFIIVYFVYVVLIATTHICLMISFKNEEYGLGHLILYSNMGGFMILYLLYLWVCVVSFAQIIHELRCELDGRNLITGVRPVLDRNIISAHLGKSFIKY